MLRRTGRSATPVVGVTAVAVGMAMTVAACGGDGGGGSDGAVDVGIIYSKTGLLAGYGKEYKAGFLAGLDYATKGTGKAGGHKIKVTWKDSAGEPDTAVAAAKTLVGKGYKIIGGATSSAVALQLAKLAKRNKVLNISGPAAVDGITGANKYTFRSGRQTYQDVKTAGTLIGDPTGKSVLVFAQDYAFGKANVKAVKEVLGGAGAEVTSLLAPPKAKDFAPFAQKIKDAHPDLLFVAWAGSSTKSMWRTLDRQGVFDKTTVVTGLGDRASFDSYGPAASKVKFLSYYFPTATDNPVNAAMTKAIEKAGGEPDLFSPDGFVAAQMIVHAVQTAEGDDVGTMISALDGWTFQAPKGSETVRAGDHAMIQPMFIAKLVRDGDGYTPKPVKTIPATAVAPPK